MATQTRAKASYVLMSPRKVQLVLALIRGKYVDDAVAILRATPNRAARTVEKLVLSATANAENNHQLSHEALKVKGGFADSGPTLKRIQPRAMGRAFRIIKRTSHITVVLEETEAKPSARRLARTVTKADARGRRGRREETVESKPAKKAPKAKEAARVEAPAEEPVTQTAAPETEVQTSAAPEVQNQAGGEGESGEKGGQ